MTIRKVTVLGAGTMGAQLAAILVNAGLKVKLLDIVIDDNDPNKISKAAYEKITHPKKPLLFDLALAPHLTYGNFQDDLADDDADLYLEAVKEDLEVKHQLWQQVAKTAKPEALFATNTSGIPIEAIAKVFSPEDKKRFVGFKAVGVDPKLMGIGPAFAIPEVLKLTNLTIDDMDLVELNEAFASQILASMREVGLSTEKTNVNGGAIALGHPLGATGAILTARLLAEMRKRSDARYGMVTMCIGVGMGAAGIFELVK
ncbi:hypothetical protein FMF07_01620 [Staphylococcus delphini]|nr:hypothetical protein [Staphylococcus delphini]